MIPRTLTPSIVPGSESSDTEIRQLPDGNMAEIFERVRATGVGVRSSERTGLAAGMSLRIDEKSRIQALELATHQRLELQQQVHADALLENVATRRQGAFVSDAHRQSGP